MTKEEVEQWEEEALKRGLTVEQIELIKKNSKPVIERPSYYRATKKEAIRITKDFENFLILAPAEFKEAALELINSYKASDEWETEKRNITQDILKNDEKYINTVLEELEDKLGDYTNFRKSFSELKYTSAPEVSYFMEDLQQGIGTIYYYQDRYFQLQNFSSYLKDRELNIFDTENLKETQSWRGPLISYNK